LKPVDTPLTEVAAYRDEAAALVDELKFNEGAQN
jgi:iron(III) transport system substrate-binding protein